MPAGVGCAGGLARLSDAVHDGLSRSFKVLGVFASRHPFMLIFLPLALTAGLGTVALLEFKQDENPGRLYAPHDADSIVDREYVREEFGYPVVMERLYAVANSGKGKNLLEKSVAKQNLLEFMELWEHIRSFQTTLSGFLVTFDDICYRTIPAGECKRESILDAWEYDMAKLVKDDDVLGTINSENITDLFGRPLDIDGALGAIQRGNGGAITGAEIFQLVLEIDTDLSEKDEALLDLLKNSKGLLSDEQRRGLDEVSSFTSVGSDPRGWLWDRELVDEVHSWHETKEGRLQAFYSSVPHVYRVAAEAVRKDLAWVLLAALLVGAYSTGVLSANNWVAIKSHMVLFSVLSVGLSCISAIGFSIGLGVKFNLVISAVPFLLLGLGIDDTFIILGALKKTDVRSGVQQRIGEMMAGAGPAIFVTSITDFAAFLLTMFTDIPALVSFSVYSSAGIFFTFVYQSTFLLSCVVLEAYREERLCRGALYLGFGPVPDTGRSTQGDSNDSNPSSEHPGAQLPPLMTSLQARVPIELPLEPLNMQEDGAADLNRVLSADRMDGDPASACPALGSTIFGNGAFDPGKPSLTTRLVGEWLPKVSLSKWGRVGVVFVEMLMLAAGIFGARHTHTDFQFKDWFTPQGSRMQKAFQIQDDHFGGDQNPFSIYTKGAPAGSTYFDFQDQFVAVMDATRNNEFVAEKPRVFGWYEDFSQWLNSTKPETELSNGRAPNATAFVDLVREFVRTDGALYHDDVRFDDTGDDIAASRLVRGHSRDLVDGDYTVKFVDSVRRTARRGIPQLDPFVYNFFFPFVDGLRVIQFVTLRNVLMAGAAVFLVVLATLANFLAAVAVVLMIGLTDVMLFGYMWYIGMTFNIVTSINVILAVGIAVDYSTHVAYAFLGCNAGDRAQRAASALRQVGADVLAGGFTTFLAVAALYFAEHYIMDVFFAMMSAIVALGLWHGLVVLPVVLSYIGPGACEQRAQGGGRGV
eukprot:evm.model.scf_971.2 EVM.evm.TU.scf_971.2   scf_971:22748-36081(-)